MDTFDDIFDELNGPSGVGRLIGKSTEHVAAMRRRRSIPVRYWPRLIEGARGRGVNLDEAILVAVHQPTSEPTP